MPARKHAVCRYLFAGMMIACVSSETIDGAANQSDATTGTDGKSTTMGHDGSSATGGVAASSGIGGNSTGGGSAGTRASSGIGGNSGASGGFGGNSGRGSSAGTAGTGGTGGPDTDASAGRSGFSGAAGHDASRDPSTIDAAADEIGEASTTDSNDAEGGTCGPMFCFDVFECWILFPQCGYTACDLFACK